MKLQAASLPNKDNDPDMVNAINNLKQDILSRFTHIQVRLHVR